MKIVIQIGVLLLVLSLLLLAFKLLVKSRLLPLSPYREYEPLGRLIGEGLFHIFGVDLIHGVREKLPIHVSTPCFMR